MFLQSLRALEYVCDVAHELVVVLEDAGRPGLVTKPPRVVPSVVAIRLAYGAVRVLPAGGRCRYREEFDSELYELAAAGASRWAQLLYGLRLIDRAWVLRAELREAAARGKAVRP